MHIPKQLKKYQSLLPTFLASITMIGVGGIILYFMGRLPLGPDGKFGFWSGEVQSQFNSQRLLDAYSFTHIIHGIIFYALLSFFAKWLPARTRFLIALGFEVIWEIIENTDMTINRYRAETLSLNYYGDSILNSTSDMLVACIGFILAWRLPVWLTVTLAIGIEIILALTIRDGLFLNILLLLWPLESVKNWQLGI
jgi:hypothetical protein